MSLIKIDTTLELINNFKGNVAVGTLVETLGYASVGDGGGAQWSKTATIGTASKSPAQLGDARLSDKGSNEWALVHSGTIDPMKLGATEAAEDNYDFLQAALNGGKIIDLQSNYFDYNGTLTSSKVGAGIIGNGSSTCGLQPTNTTANCISFADPAGPMRGAVFKGFSINPTPNSKTAGKALKLDGVRNFIINDVIIDKGFWGIHMLGCSQGFIDNVLVIFENDNGGVITGRKYLRIEETANANITSKHPGDLFFTNFNGRCGGTPYCEVGIEVHSGDGIWFDNYHIGNCVYANIWIIADRTARCTGLKFSNGWHDIGTGSGTIITGSTPTTIGKYQFSGVKLLGGNVGKSGYDIDGSAEDIQIGGAGTEISGYRERGIRVRSGFTGDLTARGFNIHDCSLTNTGTYDGIVDESTAGTVRLEDGEVTGTNHRYHVNIQQSKASSYVRNIDVSKSAAVSGSISHPFQAESIIDNNKGYNPTGANSPVVGVSPWTFPNNRGYPVRLISTGGTVSQIKVNNTVINAKTEIDIVLSVGESVEITYSSTPSVYAFGM